MVREDREKEKTQVREIVTSLIRDEERAPLTLPISKDSLFWVIAMGIEHERIHIETSSVILSRMPIHLVNPSPFFPVCQKAAKSVAECLRTRNGFDSSFWQI